MDQRGAWVIVETRIWDRVATLCTVNRDRVMSSSTSAEGS